MAQNTPSAAGHKINTYVSFGQTTGNGSRVSSYTIVINFNAK